MGAGIVAPAIVAVSRHRQPLCGVSIVICQGEQIALLRKSS
jgi:hypothetical protein